ncbi:MAG: hypothetical protein ACKPKO_02555, partial [Candidatus Fonsibacter sp.]
MFHYGFESRIFQGKAIIGCRTWADVVAVIGEVVGHYPQGIEGLGLEQTAGQHKNQNCDFKVL